jgi:putative membrane protein
MQHTSRALGLSACTLAASMLLASPASAQMTPNGTMSMRSVDSADAAFLMKASEANVGEIAAGRLAERKGSTNAVRLFGKRLADDHGANERKLAMLAQRLGVQLPMHPTAEDRMQMQRLQALSGTDFDQAFLRAEERGHEKNIVAFKRETGNGASPAVVAYARKTLPTLDEHLLIATDDANRLRMAMNDRGMMNGGMRNGTNGANAGTNGSAMRAQNAGGNSGQNSTMQSIGTSSNETQAGKYQQSPNNSAPGANQGQAGANSSPTTNSAPTSPQQPGTPSSPSQSTPH